VKEEEDAQEATAVRLPSQYDVRIYHYLITATKCRLI